MTLMNVRDQMEAAKSEQRLLVGSQKCLSTQVRMYVGGQQHSEQEFHL